MRTRNLPAFVTLAALICIFFIVSQGSAARKTVGLEDRVRALDFSKAVPGQLNYQGYLVDSTDSSAVTATLEMTFRLYDTETKGAELWSETHPAVEVSNGLFQVLLGSVTPFALGLFDGTAMWLQTEVGAEVLTPRKPLVSVAYSQRSQEADHAILADTAAYAQVAGMTFADSAVVADNAHHLAGQSLGNLDDRWVNEEDLDHLDAADGDPADAVYVDNAGRVGIGTMAPARNLHVYDDADNVVGLEIENPSTGASSIEMITFTDENGGLAGVATYDDGSTYPSAMRIYNNRPNGTIGMLTNSLERVRVNNDGKVGIGTSMPSYTLDVNGAVNATTYWGDGSNLTGIAGAPDADWTISGSDMYSGVAGNVGIGTSTPGYPLHVYNYSGYSPSYAGYFHAVGHEATGNAYAVYANAQADDENAYGIYSTATSTWGQAYAGYFNGDVEVIGDVQADTLILGSSSKAGRDGSLELYRDGLANPIVELGDKWDDGAIMWFRNSAGYTHLKIETDVDGSGTWFNLYRNNTAGGLNYDGNYSGTEEPRLSIFGSTRSALFRMDQTGDNSVVLPASAISAPEVLDEPGVASNTALGSVTLTGPVETLLSRSITVPDSGYVLAIGTLEAEANHTSGGGFSWAIFGVSDVSTSLAGNQDLSPQLPSAAATGSYLFPVTSHGLFEVLPGLNTFYLLADEGLGDWSVWDMQLTLIFFRTAYGTVTPTKSGGPSIPDHQAPQVSSLTPADIAAERAQAEAFDAARIERELAAMRAELEELQEQVQNQNSR